MPEVLLAQSPGMDVKTDLVSLTPSLEVREAIDAGVILTFDCDFAMRNSWWVFTKSENNILHRYTLTRHTLSNRYIVQDADGEAPRIFRSITEASNYIAAQARLLLESYSSDQQPYSMRISLNKFELPTPMRLKAFVANSWDLDTGWILWVSEN